LFYAHEDLHYVHIVVIITNTIQYIKQCSLMTGFIWHSVHLWKSSAKMLPQIAYACKRYWNVDWPIINCQMYHHMRSLGMKHDSIKIPTFNENVSQ